MCLAINFIVCLKCLPLLALGLGQCACVHGLAVGLVPFGAIWQVAHCTPSPILSPTPVPAQGETIREKVGAV